jgi:hypothetical protein
MPLFLLKIRSGASFMQAEPVRRCLFLSHASEDKQAGFWRFSGSGGGVAIFVEAGLLLARLDFRCFTSSLSQNGQLRAGNYWQLAGWSASILLGAPAGTIWTATSIAGSYLVTHQVYVPTAYVGKALARVINVGSAGGVVGFVDSELSSYNCDQAGTRMRVPPSVGADWKRVSGDIDVRISPDVHLEVPREPRARLLSAHQVQQARWIVAYGQCFGVNPAHRGCDGRRDDGQRQCDEKWQN